MRNASDCNYKIFWMNTLVWANCATFHTHPELNTPTDALLHRFFSSKAYLSSLYICGIKKELFSTWRLSTASWENRKHPIVCLTGKKNLNMHNMFLKNKTGPGCIIIPYMLQCSHLWGMLSTSRPETQMQHCCFTLWLVQFCLRHHQPWWGFTQVYMDPPSSSR